MKQQVKAALAILLVGGLIYVVYSQLSGRALLPGLAVVTAPPEPDLSKLADLKAVASVESAQILGGAPGYDLGGRNLFQYGPPKPPPPTPQQLEAMRKAEETRLKAMEEEARKRAEEDQKRQQEEAERHAKEAKDAQEAAEKQKLAEQLAPPKPVAPPKPPPPPVNLRLLGYLGPQEARIAVFLNGKDILLGKKGDIVDGKFKVLDLGIESVDLGYVDPAYADERKRIDLTQ